MHARIASYLRVVELHLQGSNVLQINIVDALVEKQRKYVTAKLGMIDSAPQEIGGLFKKGVELCLGQATLWAGLRSVAAVPHQTALRRSANPHSRFISVFSVRIEF